LNDEGLKTEMIEGILGKKVGMTQIFGENGEIVPITVIEAGPCYVTQVRTQTKDGYEAVQLGFSESKKLNDPERGHLKNLPGLRILREINATEVDTHQVGETIDAAIFAAGEKVDITGTSKGKGFAGTVKRHNFSGGPKTHGQSDRHRAPGSIGAGSTPGKVWKDMRMAGHMGNETVTIQNLEVVEVDPERNLIAVKGAVPGPNKGLVIVRKAVKNR
jgi:large subunit ribosomal protein L3